MLHMWNKACSYGVTAPYSLQQIADDDRLEHLHNDINFHLIELLEHLLAGSCAFPAADTLFALFGSIDALPLAGHRRASFHFLYSDLYVYHRRLDGALIQLSKSFALNPQPQVPIRQAIMSASAGNYADGLVFLERARLANMQRLALLPSFEAEIARVETDFKRLLESQSPN